MKQNARTPRRKNQSSFIIGISLTILIAGIAKYLSLLPFFSIMGELVIAILIGVIWRSTIGLPKAFLSGTEFSSKKLLRVGIILLGFRLHLGDVSQVGPTVFLLASISLVFTLVVVFLLTRVFHVETRLGILTACGTAICGAAAVVAIAPQIKAKNEEIAIGAAIVAILGTMFTILYTVLFPFLGLSANGYGIFSGATLHELAHVVAAAAPGGDAAVDLAVVVKLTRVALLIPVALVIGFWYYLSQTEKQDKPSFRSLPIPWFIIGFLCTSALYSLGIIPNFIADTLVGLSYLFIGTAMAGLGLNIQLSSLKQFGLNPLAASFIGSILLSLVGYLLIHLFGLV
ncbi:YeiH family protein [Halalkalibacter alkalisediminis]|uniref:YeiH family protein n=1 Tax=Halalkalibacter alkalisediminis TaxID=935616 RepID=A0ABV6NIR4_9BACI|nr:YeiH family protein [Halalkalibacter alkalisediminis]